MASFLSPALSRAANAHLMSMYYLSVDGGGGLGAPVREMPFALAAAGAGAGSYPSEVATCLSVTATATGIPEHAPGGARPKSRHRGRIFIGPVSNLTSATVGATSEIVVSDPYRQVLAAAATKLIEEAGQNNITWVIWSRTDNALRPITGGFVDDAYDTVRSRGQKPSTRTNFGTPQSLNAGSLPASLTHS